MLLIVNSIFLYFKFKKLFQMYQQMSEKVIYFKFPLDNTVMIWQLVNIASNIMLKWVNKLILKVVFIIFYIWYLRCKKYFHQAKFMDYCAFYHDFWPCPFQKNIFNLLAGIVVDLANLKISLAGCIVFLSQGIQVFGYMRLSKVIPNY